MKAKTTKKARISAKAVTTPELYSYLKRHRLCRKYLRNLKEQQPDWIKNIITEEWTPQEMIAASFTWSKTPEGLAFWRKHSNRCDKDDVNG